MDTSTPPARGRKYKLGGDWVTVFVFMHVLLFLSLSVNVDGKFHWLALTGWPEFHAIELRLPQRSCLEACWNPTVPSMIRCCEGAPERESRRYGGFCLAAMDKQCSFWELISCLVQRLTKTSVPSSKWRFVCFLWCKKLLFLINFFSTFPTEVKFLGSWQNDLHSCVWGAVF